MVEFVMSRLSKGNWNGDVWGKPKENSKAVGTGQDRLPIRPPFLVTLPCVVMRTGNSEQKLDH